RAAGPSPASAATAVATLALDAGVAGLVAARAKSTRPDARSVTTTPTRGPSEREAIRGASSAVRPWLVGRAPADTAGVRTAAGAATRTVATRGICQSASRGGRSAATATPAPSVKTLSITSAVTTVSRTRLATTGPLTRCLARNPEIPAALGSPLSRMPGLAVHSNWPAGHRSQSSLRIGSDVMQFDVVVEIPKGQRNKYEVDHESGRIRLDRMLFTSTRYPSDY